MMNKRRVQILMSAAIVCSSCLYASCENGNPGDVSDRGYCGDVQCETGEYCIQNVCVKKDDIEDIENVDLCESLKCDEGTHCVAGLCEKNTEPEKPSQEGDCGGKTCTNDQVCENEQCVDKTPVVEDLCGGEVCKAPMICKEGECVEDTRIICGEYRCNEGEICNENQECADPNPCPDGNCVIPSEPEPEPEPDPEQPGSEKCGDTVCEDGQTCIDDECVSYTPVVCGDQTCTADQICDESTKECVDREEEPVFEPEPDPDPVIIEGAFIVSPTSGITTRRSGQKAEFSIKLNQKPTKNVKVPIKSLNTKYGTVSAESVEFTTENWNEDVAIFVTGTTEQTLENKTYKIQVGPISGDEATFKSAPAVNVSVTHIDDIVKDGDCTGDKKKDDAGKCISQQVKDIKLSNASVRLLRGSTATVTATVQPADATNQDLKWTLVSSSRKDEDPGKVLSMNFDTDPKKATFKSKITGGRTITVRVESVSNKSVSKEFTVNVKPYTEAKFYGNNGSSTGLRNYHFTKTEKDDLTCKYYGDDSAKIFNQDMYIYYVEPKMLKGNNGKKYGTRASVVEAARFLTLRFPYDIPYYMGTISSTKQETRSHYIWTTNPSEKASDVKSVRIYGLNLRPSVYNNYESKSGLYSEGKGDVIKEDATPWGCTFDKSGVTTYNGLECSGFVTWAFRNGHVSLGDWKTHIFAPNEDCGKKRNFRCISYVNGVNPNNSHDGAYTKLSALEESDFISFGEGKAVTSDQQKKIKAGDIVWHGTNGGKLKSGHVAMILGITRNTDKTIKDIYIAEATGGTSTSSTVGTRSGNSVRKYTWKDFISSTAWSGKNSYIIMMGHVYNYYTDISEKYKVYFEGVKDSEGNAVHGDTTGYTDMW